MVMFPAILRVFKIVLAEIPAGSILNNCSEVESLGQCDFKGSLKAALSKKKIIDWTTH